jgi:hypothetical protein
LTVATSRKQLAHKLVTELAMPPGVGPAGLVEREAMNDPPLTSSDVATLEGARTAGSTLLSRLEAERTPALQAWLLETRCD